MKHVMIGVLVLTLAAPAAAQTDLLVDPEVMARVEASVDRGLEYLAQTQRADGSWSGQWARNNGINALSLLAFLGRGHAPGRGPYAPVIDRAIEFIAATQIDSGLFRSPNPSQGPMYEHALATLAMTEAYGFLPSTEMRERCQRAIDLIVRS